MELKSKVIKLFCSTVETGSLLAAANKLAVSPSAASREIAQLEQRLGLELFTRSNKALSLTEGGREFYRIARESVQAWTRLEDWSVAQRSQRKRIRIAVLARHCSDLILPAVAKILKHHKKTLSVAMDIHTSRDIHYSKFSHPFDIGFGTLISEHDDLQKVVLAYLPLKLVVSRDHPLASRKFISAKELEKESFVLLSQDIPESKLALSMLPNLKPEQISVEVSNTQVALRFAQRNLGVHITDELAAKALSKDCATLSIRNTKNIAFSVFWPSQSPDLWDEICECIAEIAKSIQSQGISITPEARRFIEANSKKNALKPVLQHNSC